MTATNILFYHKAHFPSIPSSCIPNALLPAEQSRRIRKLLPTCHIQRCSQRILNWSQFCQFYSTDFVRCVHRPFQQHFLGKDEPKTNCFLGAHKTHYNILALNYIRGASSRKRYMPYYFCIEREWKVHVRCFSSICALSILWGVYMLQLFLRGLNINLFTRTLAAWAVLIFGCGPSISILFRDSSGEVRKNMAVNTKVAAD